MFEKAKILKERYGKDISTPFLQELIWFHRIKADQDKELLSLEFFNVCASHSLENKLFNKELITANYRKDIQIRNVIYNFPELEGIVISSLSESEKWEKIIATLNEKLDGNLNYTYNYLKERFESVSVFFTSIKLLRKASLGMDSSKRWTSKFLFPFSFETMFVDLDNRKSKSMDRRFFSRGGEVLYLMISRAENTDVLKGLMQDVFVNSKQNERWSKLLTMLRSEKDNYTTNTQLGFLSTSSHKVFDQLVDDLICLFESNIPNNDIFDHFSSLSAFYMVHFILTIALENKKTSLLRSGEEKIIYPVELLAPYSDHVRRSSRQIYKINEDLPLEALKVVFNNYFESLDTTLPNEELLEKLEKELNYNNDDDKYEEYIDWETLKSKIWNKISMKAKSDLLSIHRILLKGSGLASVKKTNSYRYLASDEWLKTLVLVNIESRMPFLDFIDLLFTKYGFIITNKHSNLLLESYSENDYRKNETRLFERLRALGLLESKSDGYAYVINRYGRK